MEDNGNDQEKFIQFFIFSNLPIPENKKIFFNNINIENFLLSFSYLPKEDRLAHQLGTRIVLETINFDNESKIWSFNLILESITQKYCEVILSFVDDIDIKDVEKYKMIFQVCLNGDLENREFLDKIGILTQTSAWRCSYCGGIFGVTYQDCLDHEVNCKKNPTNRNNKGHFK